MVESFWRINNARYAKKLNKYNCQVLMNQEDDSQQNKIKISFWKNQVNQWKFPADSR